MLQLGEQSLYRFIKPLIAALKSVRFQAPPSKKVASKVPISLQNFFKLLETDVLSMLHSSIAEH
jgi:hypothetical protein